jgi:hypothetical protein
MSMNDKSEPTLIDEDDEEIARIREVRHRISEEFGHDPYRLVAHYMELQKEHPEKLIPAPDPEIAGKRRGE